MQFSFRQHCSKQLLSAFVIAISVVPTLLAAEPIGHEMTRASQFANAKAQLGKWVWIPRDDTRCRDGTTTGMGVRLLPGKSAAEWLSRINHKPPSHIPAAKLRPKS